jgi:acetoin utilization deacetylase AcuC-like enzyme
MTTAFYSHPDCHAHDMGRGHPECPQRLDAINDHLLATGLDIALQRIDAPLVDLRDVACAHSSGYVDELRDLLEQVQADGRPRALDPDTAAGPGTWAAVQRAAGLTTPSARCARPVTMRRATRRWASASSTTSRSRPVMRSTRAA